jgi:hypothetical protein
MDEQSIMQYSGQYEPVPLLEPQKEDLTPAQKEIMASLFGKYYKQAGKAMMYLKTPNGQKIVGTTLLFILLAIATKKKGK